MSGVTMFQVSTLQALVLGYTKDVIKVGEFLQHGDIGLGTFEDVNGEMIVIDGRCYQAGPDGRCAEAAPDTGVPFAVITRQTGEEKIAYTEVENIDQLKQALDLHIDEGFSLNSMHVVRLDGLFEQVMARSESGYESQHIELKDILKDRQKDFVFENVSGSIVAIYFPNYMDGINAAGWHFHFISDDRTMGGHVFDVKAKALSGSIESISKIDIQLPTGPAYDTYDMKSASAGDIKSIEQGKE